MEKDYYKILGVDKNSSQEDIKKAFRKLSLKYHPDRQSGKSDSEKKYAEEQFKLITEAYETLGDPEKRKKYDTPSMGNIFDDLGDFGWNIWSSFTTTGNAANNVVIERGQDLEVKLKIGIKDIYSGFSKVFKYKKNIRCSSCGGSGGKTATCDNCKGTGRIRTRTRTLMGFMDMNIPCDKCNGKGLKIIDFCKKCKGFGFESSEANITVNLPSEKTIINNQTYRFTGYGSESKDSRGTSGDLYVTIIHDYDSNKYFITPSLDIIETVEIPYTGILLGCKWPVILPNDEEVMIDIKSCLPCNTLIEIPGKGINGKKYFTKIIPKFPEKLNDSQINLLQQLISL